MLDTANQAGRLIELQSCQMMTGCYYSALKEEREVPNFTKANSSAFLNFKTFCANSKKYLAAVRYCVLL